MIIGKGDKKGRVFLLGAGWHKKDIIDEIENGFKYYDDLVNDMKKHQCYEMGDTVISFITKMHFKHKMNMSDIATIFGKGKDWPLKIFNKLNIRKRPIGGYRKRNLTTQQVKHIRAGTGLTPRDYAKLYNVNLSVITQCQKEKTYVQKTKN